MKGIFPEESSGLIPSGTKFCFCHIDVDIYHSAKDIVDWIYDRLIPGGIIIFDDYGFHWTLGITKLVNELRTMEGHSIIHNLNGHAILIKH